MEPGEALGIPAQLGLALAGFAAWFSFFAAKPFTNGPASYINSSRLWSNLRG
jgi:hypothetical protein